MSLIRDRRRGSYQARRLLGLSKPLGDVVPDIAKVALLSFSTAAQIVVALQAGSRIRVHAYELWVLGLEVVTFHSWTGSVATALTGDIGIDATRNKGLPLHVGFSPMGHFQTLIGEHLLFLPVLGTVTTGTIWYSRT